MLIFQRKIRFLSDHVTFSQENASQCGYCTPGFVMSLSAMLESNEKLTRSSVKDGLTGNLCRCTGYEQIIEAALSINILRNEKSITNLFNSKSMLADFKEHSAQSVYCNYEERWNGLNRKFQYFVPISLKEALEFTTIPSFWMTSPTVPRT